MMSVLKEVGNSNYYEIVKLKRKKNWKVMNFAKFRKKAFGSAFWPLNQKALILQYIILKANYSVVLILRAIIYTRLNIRSMLNKAI